MGSNDWVRPQAALDTQADRSFADYANLSNLTKSESRALTAKAQISSTVPCQGKAPRNSKRAAT